MIKSLKAAFLVALSMLVWPLGAQAYEYETLFSKGAWSARVELWPDGDLSCAMTTVQDRARLDITRYQGVNGIQIWMEFLGIPKSGEDRIDVILQVDRRAPWTLYDASIDGPNIIFHMRDTPDADRLLVELMQGKRLYLIEQGDVYHSWSLSGSFAAMAATADCVQKL